MAILLAMVGVLLVALAFTIERQQARLALAG